MTTTHPELYANIGFVLYSIAASDRRIAPAEVEVFKQQVKKNWLPLEDSTDEFGTDAAHYISISFDYAHEQGMSADDAFERFKDHYRDAPGSCDEVTRQLVRNTAAAIAAAFSGKNKAELVRLAQVEALFAHN